MRKESVKRVDEDQVTRQRRGGRYGERRSIDDKGGRKPTRYRKGQETISGNSRTPGTQGTSCEAHHALGDSTRSGRVEEGICRGAFPVSARHTKRRCAVATLTVDWRGEIRPKLPRHAFTLMNCSGGLRYLKPSSKNLPCFDWHSTARGRSASHMVRIIRLRCSKQHRSKSLCAF